MKTLCFGLALLSVIVLAPALLAADVPARAVSIDHARTYRLTLGQSARFVFKYDGFAGEIITGLDVVIDSRQIRNPTVESSFDPSAIEIGVKTFVFRPEKAGTYHVVIAPLRGQARSQPRFHTLIVTAE